MHIAQTPGEPDDWNRIRCVVFDAVGTVIFAQPAVAEVYAAIGERHGSKRTQAEISRQFRAVFPRLLAEHNTRGVLPGQTSEEDESQFWRDVVTAIFDDVEQPRACFQELWDHFARPVAWRCFDDVGPTISSLTGRGCEIVIASNFDDRLHQVCDGLLELRNVARRVISSRVGFRKPSVRFFEATLEIVGYRADEVLMVGDDFQNDVTAARKAGLKACWLRRNGSTKIHPAADAITSLTVLSEMLP